MSSLDGTVRCGPYMSDASAPNSSPMALIDSGLRTPVPLLKLEGLWLGDGGRGGICGCSARPLPWASQPGESSRRRSRCAARARAWRRSLMSTWNCRTSSERRLNYGGSKSVCAVGGRQRYLHSLKLKRDENKISVTETGTYGSCRMRLYTLRWMYSRSRAYWLSGVAQSHVHVRLGQCPTGAPAPRARSRARPAPARSPSPRAGIPASGHWCRDQRTAAIAIIIISVDRRVVGGPLTYTDKGWIPKCPDFSLFVCALFSRFFENLSASVALGSSYGGLFKISLREDPASAGPQPIAYY